MRSFLRLDASDPRLKDTLYSAFRVFERIETTDEIAQVAVSCRRFIAGLADILYPPRNEMVKGGEYRQPSTRNRLWPMLMET